MSEESERLRAYLDSLDEEDDDGYWEADQENNGGAAEAGSDCAGTDATDSAGEDEGAGATAGGSRGVVLPQWAGIFTATASLGYSPRVASNVLMASYFPAPEEKIPDGGIVVGEIVAWRCWRAEITGCLFSTTMGTPWLPGEPMTGDFANSVGVHAWKTRASAMSYARDAYAGVVVPIIVGKIRLSGVVIEHEHGYRAECGEIESLDCIVAGTKENSKTVLARARALYGVDGDGGYLSATDPLPATGRSLRAPVPVRRILQVVVTLAIAWTLTLAWCLLLASKS